MNSPADMRSALETHSFDTRPIGFNRFLMVGGQLTACVSCLATLGVLLVSLSTARATASFVVTTLRPSSGHASVVCRATEVATTNGDGDASWRTTGGLNAARAFHAAVRLQDGRVLVAGGVGVGALDSAELFDPVMERWTLTGSLDAAWSAPGVALLSDGQVLLVGGFGSDFKETNRAALFDPATGLWTATDRLNTARFSHTATGLSDGRVLVAGGTGSDGNAVDSSELFDLATGLWTPADDLGAARSDHTAALLSDGRVLVAGGRDASGRILGSAELYVPAGAGASVKVHLPLVVR